jgi:hypothetical protein
MVARHDELLENVALGDTCGNRAWSRRLKLCALGYAIEGRCLLRGAERQLVLRIGMGDTFTILASNLRPSACIAFQWSARALSVFADPALLLLDDRQPDSG